jgi:hypothetical protein
MVGRIPRGQHPTLWQDFTFCDLAMIGKTQKGRAELNTAVMHTFRKKVKRKYPVLWLVYRKEWDPRKSGMLIGEDLPHNHCLVGGIGGYGHPFTVAAELALMWVNCTHIVDKETYREALAVALHRKSYRLIETLTAALRYVTKYTGKLSDVHLDDAGRAWGRIGDVPQAEPIIERMTDSEDAWFRRLARRSLRKGKKVTSRTRRFKKTIADQGRDTFIYLSIENQKRIIARVKGSCTKVKVVHAVPAHFLKETRLNVYL